MLELFVTGLVLGNTICVFSSCSISPVLYISASGSDTKGALKSLFIFSSAKVIAYALLGAAAGISGRWLKSILGSAAYHLTLGIITGIIIIFTGLLLIYEKKLPEPVCKIIGKARLKKGSIDMALLGFLMALAPCAPLMGMLSQTFAKAGGITAGSLGGLLFGLGTSVSLPLWLLGLLTGYAPLKILTHQGYYRIFRYICSSLLIIIGIRFILYAV